jgi:hypothetical protein
MGVKINNNKKRKGRIMKAYLLLTFVFNIFYINNINARKYEPGNNEEFTIVENGLSKYGPFCKKAKCKPTKHIYYSKDDLLGSSGYFKTDKPINVYSGYTNYMAYKVGLAKKGEIYLLIKNNANSDNFSIYGDKYLKDSFIRPVNYIEMKKEHDEIIKKEYKPEGKEVFVFWDIPAMFQKYGYQNVCKTDQNSVCKGVGLSYDKYHGIKGYIDSLTPSKAHHIIGKYFYKVVLDNGEKLYVSTDKDKSIYDRISYLISLKEYESITNFNQSKLFEGGEIDIVSMNMEFGRMVYTLSNGKKLLEGQYELIKGFLKHVKGKAELGEMLLDVHIKYDEMDNVYFLDASAASLDKELSIYIKYGSKSSLRFKLMYVEDDWLFVNSFKASADDFRYQSPKYEFVRDNSSGSIWEFIDIEASGELINLAKKLASANKSTIRFVGENYYSDMVLSNEQKDNISKALQIYDMLNNSTGASDNGVPFPKEESLLQPLIND